MSFLFKNKRGAADEIKPEVVHSEGHARERDALSIIHNTLEQLAHALGGHVVISSQGHVAERPGPGDNINIQISTLMPPQSPAPDTGRAAAGGSPQTFPPESSTAAPATADGSPPAAQEPNPQPAVDAPDPTSSDRPPDSEEPAPETTTDGGDVGPVDPPLTSTESAPAQEISEADLQAADTHPFDVPLPQQVAAPGGLEPTVVEGSHEA